MRGGGEEEGEGPCVCESSLPGVCAGMGDNGKKVKQMRERVRGGVRTTGRPSGIGIGPGVLL